MDRARRRCRRARSHSAAIAPGSREVRSDGPPRTRAGAPAVHLGPRRRARARGSRASRGPARECILDATRGDLVIVGKIWDCEYPWDVRVEKVTDALLAAGHEVHLMCRNRTGLALHERIGALELH